MMRVGEGAKEGRWKINVPERFLTGQTFPHHIKLSSEAYEPNEPHTLPFSLLFFLRSFSLLPLLDGGGVVRERDCGPVGQAHHQDVRGAQGQVAVVGR